jgi:hypothetical protein
MRYSSAVISFIYASLSGASFAVAALEIQRDPELARLINRVAAMEDKRHNNLEARDCECSCVDDCNSNCGSFGGTPGSQLAAGLCLVTCGDSCGCGGDEVCGEADREEACESLNSIDLDGLPASLSTPIAIVKVTLGC